MFKLSSGFELGSLNYLVLLLLQHPWIFSEFDGGGRIINFSCIRGDNNIHLGSRMGHEDKTKCNNHLLHHGKTMAGHSNFGKDSDIKNFILSYCLLLQSYVLYFFLNTPMMLHKNPYKVFIDKREI